jgi:aminodeoxyfutalosine synthase
VGNEFQDGERLSFEDGRVMFSVRRSARLGPHGELGERGKKTGARATFVMNRQINPTNVCVLSCHFCDYATKEKRPNAYIMTKQENSLQVERRVARKFTSSAASIAAGVSRNTWTSCAFIRQKFPKIQVKAYTAVEIDFFARREGQAVCARFLRP